MNRIIETEIGTIEYSRSGKGKPILFLHGGHSNCNETLFHKGYDKNHFQLITPSRPGYGNTPLANFDQPDSASKLISAMLTQIGIKEVIVVGISAGGLTAITLASQKPEMVSRLVLISAVTKKWLKPEDDLYRRGKNMFAPDKEKRSWKLFRFFFKLLPKTMTKVLFKELSNEQSNRITKNEIAEIREMTFKQSSGNGFVVDLDQNIADDVISKIECPTLILHSKNDKSVSIEMAQYANEMIANSKLITYENKWGHLLWIGEESKKPINDVMKFINDLKAN